MATARRSGGTAGGSAARPLSGYVLHTHDWSESSLILEIWTRELGRVVALAKGAKRPYSQLRSVLLPFQRLHLQLGNKRLEGGAEVQLLRSAEWAGGGPMLSGAALLSGLHLNELLLRGVARHDPHPHLFDAYAHALGELVRSREQADESLAAAALRAFELAFLADSGVLPDLSCVTATQQPVQPATRHLLLADAGVCTTATPGDPGISGAVLMALQTALQADDRIALQQACAGAPQELKSQLRALLHEHLGTTMLRTRALMVELQQLLDRGNGR
jgi:DNA repair protein RecO (recombination protein O)